MVYLRALLRTQRAENPSCERPKIGAAEQKRLFINEINLRLLEFVVNANRRPEELGVKPPSQLSSASWHWIFSCYGTG